MGAMSEPFRINRVVLKNYRSIAYCDVRLKNLTFLSGPNGSGKSNFMDALRFVADSLSLTLEAVVDGLGGLHNIIYAVSAPDDTLSIQLWFEAAGKFEGQYSFTLRAGGQKTVLVENEDCRIETQSGKPLFYSIAPGRAMAHSDGVPPVIADDRLHLVQAASLDGFRPVYNALSMMEFYSPVPGSMTRPQEKGPVEQDTLTFRGENVAMVLDHLAKRHPRLRNRIEAYLKGIVPNLESVSVEGDNYYRYLRFGFKFAGGERSLSFDAKSMSDGTLRALGILVALFQRPKNWSGMKAAVVGIEEPETALHPAAARVLFDALGEAAETRQVIVSTHSPDLLDSDDVDTDSILAVQMSEDGATQIGPVDDAGRSVLLKQLYTPGELMRINQLQPRPSGAGAQTVADDVESRPLPRKQ